MGNPTRYFARGSWILMALANCGLLKCNSAIILGTLSILYFTTADTACLYSAKGTLNPQHGLFLRGSKGAPIRARHGASENIQSRDPGATIRHPPWISGWRHTRGTIRLRGGSDMSFFTKLWENQEGKDDPNSHPDFLESLWETWKTSMDGQLQEANEFRSVMHERLLLMGWQVCVMSCRVVCVPSADGACISIHNACMGEAYTPTQIPCNTWQEHRREKKKHRVYSTLLSVFTRLFLHSSTHRPRILLMWFYADARIYA